MDEVCPCSSLGIPGMVGVGVLWNIIQLQQDPTLHMECGLCPGFIHGY